MESKKKLAPAVDKQTKTMKVKETFKAEMPINEGFSGALWESNSTSKATVDSSGNVTAKATGTVIITGYYTTPYKTPARTYTLTIQPAVPTVQEESRTLEVEGTFTGELPSTAGFSGSKWVSSDPSKATVVEGTGVVTAVAEGSAIITGNYTKPYETPIKKYNLTITAKSSKLVK